MTAKPLALAAAAILLTAAVAHADPTRLQQFDDWGAYSYQTKSGPSCYVLSSPKTMQPSGIDHGKNFFLVSLGGSNGSHPVPQVIRAYMLKPDAPITASVGNKSFAMFAKDNTAWVYKQDQEPALVAAMKSGSTLTVSATSKRGTATRYTYSLKGFSAALDRVKSCR